MTEIEFSYMPGNLGTAEAALAQFEAQHRIHVRMRQMDWDTAWQELLNFALHRSGPDVSLVGTTWISSLVSMNALRAFTEYEIHSLGGASAFVPAMWQSVTSDEGKNVWAVPYTSNTCVIYYRRDWLEKAGVDHETAFRTPQQIDETLQRLQQSGVATPWIVPAIPDRGALHALASWIWSAGGHLISADGKRTMFSEEAARAGIRAYFALHRYMPRNAPSLDLISTYRTFWSGQVAATIGEIWQYAQRHTGQLGTSPEVEANLGMTAPPGIPFAGGECLIIWDHSRHSREGLELIQFLTSARVQTFYLQQDSPVFPTRLEVLNQPPFTDDPHHRVIAQNLKTGQGFRAPYMWGLVESRLVTTLGELWKDLFADPGLDLDAALAERLGTLAESLDRVLAG